MTHNTAIMLDKQKWMSNVLDINRIKLTDVIWPGAHNAGMDKQAPNYEVLVGNWTTCQNGSFAWQLSNGARAFDIRLGYTEGADQSIFYFHHNGYQSHRVLDELINATLSPQYIQKQINEWFNPTRDWVTRCSIINTDFFDESEIVRYCWSATSMKAVYGDALHAPA